MSDANLPDKQESTTEKSAEPLVPEPKEIQNGENADKSSVIEPEKDLKRHGTFRKLTDEELGGHVMDSVTSRSIDKEDSSNHEELKANEQIAKETNSEETGATEAAEITFKEKGTEAEVNKVDSISLTAETKEKNASSSSFGKIRKWFSFGRKEAEDRDILRQLEEDENFNLALSRYLENSAALKSQSEKDQEAVDTCAKNLRKTFNEIKTGIEISHDKMLLKGIDWEFWSDVVNDYSAVVNDKPQQLLDHVSQGIPKELRGMVWQLICNSKSLQLEEFYRDGKNKTSNYEKSIKRDLVRTSFVTNSEVRSKIQDLYEIIKCYSLYDEEVGYTQGMAFLTVPLLMNMEASEAFCMLVKLMKNYKFRELYLPEMPGLHLKLYQFDRLLEDHLPELYVHLQKEGVRSSMYATQWFLTLFGYKFPLEMVLRVYDIVIAEGMESILRFALNLMEKNCEELLKLNFDQLVKFLKEEIFHYYLSENEEDEITADTYRLDDFVSDSMTIKILPLELHRYEAEFDEISRLEERRKIELDELRMQNSELLREIRKIEAAYATLNKEHVNIANKMVQGKIEIANLEDENEQLQREIKETTKRLTNLDKQTDTHVDFRGEISTSLDQEVQRTLQKNSEVMSENADLEEQLSSLESKLEDLKLQVKNHSRWSLRPKKVFW